jgi:hypothetical protein
MISGDNLGNCNYIFHTIKNVTKTIYIHKKLILIKKSKYKRWKAFGVWSLNQIHWPNVGL